MLRRSGAIARHELRILKHDPVFLIVFTAMPLVVMAFLKPTFRYTVAANTAGANGAEQAVPGMAVLFSLFLLNAVGFAFYREYGWGTWERLRSGWAASIEVLVGKVIVPLGQAALQLTVLFVVGGALFDLRVRGSALAIAVTAAAFAVCVVSLGLALFAVSRTIMQLNAFTNLGTMFLAGVGGAIAPSQDLPGWARAISPASPAYWAIRGFREAILFGGGVPDVVPSVAVLLGFAAGCLTIAYHTSAFRR